MALSFLSNYQKKENCYLCKTFNPAIDVLYNEYYVMATGESAGALSRFWRAVLIALIIPQIVTVKCIAHQPTNKKCC